MKTKWVAFAAVLLLGSTFFSALSLAATAEDFKTQEYKNSTGLASLQAAEAYALGFTGKGVVVGVADSYFAPPEGEFAGKYPYGYFLSDERYDHGIHVSGIIAALRNGLNANNEGMHGVAFDASLLPAAIDLSYQVNPWTHMLNIPELRVVNNSWGSPVFMDQSKRFDTTGQFSTYYYYDDFVQDFTGKFLPTLVPFALEMSQKDKLLVFAAGNYGHLSPGIESALPSVLKEYADTNLKKAEARAMYLRWLNVAAFDSAPDLVAGQYAYDPNNPNRRLSPAFVAPFTNMGLYASDYTLWAPGVSINSTTSASTYQSIGEHGTSFAAPYVSGVAALTQSAFPYMGGKQIADVLLSTATPFSMNNVPPVFALMRVEYDEFNVKPTSVTPRVVVYSYDKTKITLGDKADMTAALAKFMIPGYVKTMEEVEAELEAAIEEATILSSADEYLSLFGAGIVNAYRAVQGPGFFDAKRLENSDRVNEDVYGSEACALYSVDTQGYDSVWSNDIGQRIVPDTASADPFIGALAGLDLGLKKSGAGMLYLTGANEYLGPTVIAGGGISLGRAGQRDSAASLSGSVYVEQGGMFTGNGLIKKDLVSRGLLFPGLADTPGSVLTVSGDARIDGELRLLVRPSGLPNQLFVDGTADIAGTRVSMAGLPGGSAFPYGSFEVLRAKSVTGQPANSEALALQGATLFHSFTLNVDSANSLYAAYEHSAANPRAKALAEGFISGLGLVTQGADLVAGQGMESALRSTGEAGASGLASFGTVSGGMLRYNTGSHVDMRSLSLMTGLSKGLNTGLGRMTLGAFFEYGNGSYDTYNAFSSASAVHGDGNLYYLGGGILSRLDFGRAGPGHIYSEASGRVGSTHNEYDSQDLLDSSARQASYKSSSPYYGLHLGTGYVWEVNDQTGLDLYGKYFWTRQQGDTLTLSTNDPLDFAAITSSRLRLGARASYAVREEIKPYLGLAYEYEFDGKARATTYGYALDAPSLRGSTGLGEVGLRLTPKSSLPLTFDLGLQGYVGKREGLTGSLQVKLEF